jgi:hypothetical protein
MNDMRRKGWSTCVAEAVRRVATGVVTLAKVRITLRRAVVAGAMLTISLYVGAELRYTFVPRPADFLLYVADNRVSIVRQMVVDGKVDVNGLYEVRGSGFESGYRSPPLHVAACEGNVELVRDLLTWGADPNGLNYANETPLIALLGGEARSSHFECVQLLLRAGTDVNVRSKGGVTALHCAAKRGEERYVTMLLKLGADLQATDSFGRNPATYWTDMSSLKRVFRVESP